MAAFCSAVNFLRVLVIGILQETGYVSLIRGNSTFKRGKTVLANTAAIALWEKQWLNLDEESLANDDRVTR
jgi:hypothetical protein